MFSEEKPDPFVSLNPGMIKMHFKVSWIAKVAFLISLILLRSG